MRVPTVVRFPGKIPGAAESSEVLTTMDLLPTMAYLADAPVPAGDKIIDGKNIWPVLSGQEGAHSPHKAFFYHKENELGAVRSGKWKLHRPSGESGFQLFNLEEDIAEKVNVANDHPAIVEELSRMMAAFDEEMADPSRTREHATVQETSIAK